MDRMKTRSILRRVAAGGLAALATMCVLAWLLWRLGDDAGARWSGAAAVVAVVLTVIAVTVLTLADESPRPADQPE